MGCETEGRYAGALAYTDDVTLVAPSFLAMRLMLRACEEFAERYDVLFNGTKSVSIVINAPRGIAQISDFSLHGNIIPREDNVLHLGSWMGKDSTILKIGKPSEIF